MYDLSKEFNDFYTNYVVLSSETQDDLRSKKRLNLKRLNDGLSEYNEEKDSSYKVLENKEQGSIAMATVVQNDSHDYDIDVAIVFDEDNIGDDTGTTTIKHVVVDALKRKCKQFNTEPEQKTNCVRIQYSDGYHIDFAIYKKADDTYYHAGSEWHKRDPMAINNWFSDEVKSKGEKLRQVVRLSKMFCKSRNSWCMPGGLIQSVLCVECFEDYDRLDECFYYTMLNVLNRLETSIEVYNPTDASQSLLLVQDDREKMENWKTRLSEKLSKLDTIKKSDCTKKQAFDCWHTFFNHDFWQYVNESETNNYANIMKNYSPAPGEEFIEEKYPVDICYNAKIDCNIETNGFKAILLSAFLRTGKWLPHNRDLTFYCDTNTPKPYDVLWKIRNVGPEAEKRMMTRGEIIKSNREHNRHYERTDFYGPHFVECYIIKNNICVAKARISVPIS